MILNSIHPKRFFSSAFRLLPATLVAVLFGLGFTLLPDKESVVLRLQLEPGAKIGLHTDVKSTLFSDAQRSRLFTKQDISLGLAISIAAVDRERISGELTIEELAFDQNMGGMAIQYNSKDQATGANAIIDQEIRPMLNKPVALVIGTDGRLIELDRTSQILRDFELSSLGLMVYPRESVSQGSTWTRTHSIPGSQAQMEAEYTVDRIEAQTVFLSMKARMKSGSELEGLEMKGHITIDRKTGFPISQNTEMSTKLNGMGEEGQALYLTLTSKSIAQFR